MKITPGESPGANERDDPYGGYESFTTPNPIYGGS